MTKRKVICIMGEFKDKSDFIIEPVCSDECNCEYCKDAFWIEDSQQIKKDENIPNSHLETRSKPEEANADVKTGDVDNQSADNLKSKGYKKTKNAIKQLRKYSP